jgi:rare lipoprotein A
MSSSNKVKRSSSFPVFSSMSATLVAVIVFPLSGCSVLDWTGSGGLASYYGPGFHGRRTANGEIFNQYAQTAAHRDLPFGTWLKVTNRENNRSTCVRINDRGPYVGGRVLDVSKGVAARLGFIRQGVTEVEWESDSEECPAV